MYHLAKDTKLIEQGDQFDFIPIYNSLDVIAESLSKTYQRMSELPDPKLPVKYPRTPGYRPTAEENPCNAW